MSIVNDWRKHILKRCQNSHVPYGKNVESLSAFVFGAIEGVLWRMLPPYHVGEMSQVAHWRVLTPYPIWEMPKVHTTTSLWEN
jgi:hypothetical protein